MLFTKENIFIEIIYLETFSFLFSYVSHPALRIIARVRKIAKKVQVTLLRVASALLALVNIELPLAARPPMPSPLGLCSKTNNIKRTPEAAQSQVRKEVIVMPRFYAELGSGCDQGCAY